MWEELVKVGLDPKDARFYLTVLEAQRCTVAEAASLAGVTRTNAYDIVKRLVSRGLLSLTEVGPTGQPSGRSRGVLTANDPGRLLDEWAHRKNLLDDLVPRLRAVRGDGLFQPRVRFMPGEAGINSALFETLSWRSPIRGILSMKDLLTTPGPSAMREYIDGRRDRGLFLRVIRSPERDYPSGWPTNKEDLRETRFSPPEHVFTMTILIGPDSVAILSSRRENYAMMIESVEYAETQAHLFEALWGVSSS